MFKSLIAYISGNRKQLAIVGGFVLCLFVLWWNLFRHTSSEFLESPDGYEFVCQNPTCKNEFTISVSEAQSLRKNHPGEPIKCPKCGQANVIRKDSRPQRPNGS